MFPFKNLNHRMLDTSPAVIFLSNDRSDCETSRLLYDQWRSSAPKSVGGAQSFLPKK